MRQTEFWDRMTGHFGAGYVDSVSRDQVIPTLGNHTVLEALAAGDEPKAVWRAVCVHFEVPARER